MFAFDLWGDFAETSALKRRAPVSRHPAVPATAAPSAELRRKADDFIRRHELRRRVGIRVRVTENPTDGRKPRRIQGDLDNTIRSIIRMPWHTRVFLATDSEYVQQMLASHFPDARFWPKKFQDTSAGGRYVHRRDPEDMRTFMTEIQCLASCGKIVNVGGFMNEESLYLKVIEPPYDRARFCGRRPARSTPSLASDRMKGWVVCAAVAGSGIRHRFRMLSAAVKSFADKHRYAVALLWGATRGVADCRFEDLLAPVRDVVVKDVLEQHLGELRRISGNHPRIRLGNLEFQVFRPERKSPWATCFSWDLEMRQRAGRAGSPSMAATRGAAFGGDTLASRGLCARSRDVGSGWNPGAGGGDRLR